MLLMVKYAIKQHIDMIIVAGDIFHVHNPTEKMLKVLTEFISLAVKNGIMVRIITGNHDTDGINIAFESLKNMDNLYSFDGDHPMLQFYFHKQNEIAVYEEKIRGVQFLFVPWQNNMDGAINKAREIRTDVIPSVLVTHCAVDGALTNSEHEMKKTKITKKMLSGWNYVALGDFHKYQNIDENIYYSGSIVKTIWDERHDRRAFNVATFGRQGEIKKVYLPDIEFIEIEMNYSIIDEYTKDKIQEIDGKVVENSYIKVFITGEIGFGEKINLLKEHLIKCGARDVITKIVQTVRNIDGSAVVEEMDFHMNLNVLDACKMHLEKYNISDVNYIKYIEKKVA